MYDTVTIADDAPIDDEICERDWQCNEKSVGASYRVNSDGELESKGISLKDGVELEDDEHPTPDQLEEKWHHLDDFNGPMYLNHMNYHAVLMVWDGIVKETKFDPINYDEIRESLNIES